MAIKYSNNAPSAGRYGSTPITQIQYGGGIYKFVDIPAPITTPLTASGNYDNSPDIVYAWYSRVYDLTSCRNIAFTANYYYHDPESDWSDDQKYYYNAYNVFVGVTTQGSQVFSHSVSHLYGNHSYDKTQSGTITLNLDVSGLTGNYYIGVGAQGYNTYTGGQLVKPYKQQYYAEITKVAFT